MPELEEMLAALVRDPLAEDRWGVLADWLEEYDDPRRAELLRLHRKLLATCCEPEAHLERGVWQSRMVEMLAQGVQPCVQQRNVVLAEGVEMTFSFIPPGTFLMGSPESELEREKDETLHRVTLTSGYWLGIHPVTQAQWRAIMGNNPSKVNGDSLPVENVSWNDCQEFVAKLGEKMAKRFRLPIEAEWEYACRAGTTTAFQFGETISIDQANYNENFHYGLIYQGLFLGNTKPVGGFPPNAWGLIDMHGNVWEWCQDWFEDYSEGDIKDPQGGNNGDVRVLRGGSWYRAPWNCRSASRDLIEPNSRDSSIGCRVVLSPD